MMRRIRPEDREIYLKMAHDFYHSDAVLHPVPDENLTASFDEMMRSDAYLNCLIRTSLFLFLSAWRFKQTELSIYLPALARTGDHFTQPDAWPFSANHP